MTWCPPKKFLHKPLSGSPQKCFQSDPVLAKAGTVYTQRWCLSARAELTNRLCRLKPRTSRSMAASSKLQYIWSHLPVNDQFDKYWSKLYAFIIHEIEFYSPNQISCWQRQSFPTSFVGQAACRLLFPRTRSRLAASCVCWIVPTVDPLSPACATFLMVFSGLKGLKMT